jgi:hypothetical protein
MLLSCSHCPRPSWSLIGPNMAPPPLLHRPTTYRPASTYLFPSYDHTIWAPWADTVTTPRNTIIASPTRPQATTILTGGNTMGNISTRYLAITSALSWHHSASHKSLKNIAAYARHSRCTDPTTHGSTVHHRPPSSIRCLYVQLPWLILRLIPSGEFRARRVVEEPTEHLLNVQSEPVLLARMGSVNIFYRSGIAGKEGSQPIRGDHETYSWQSTQGSLNFLGACGYVQVCSGPSSCID